MNRRLFLRSAGLLLAAPAVVRISSLMPVKAFIPTSSTVRAWEFATANRLAPKLKIFYGGMPIEDYIATQVLPAAHEQLTLYTFSDPLTWPRGKLFPT